METERAMASFAIEMDVLVFDGAVVMSTASLVAQRPAAILDGVYKVVLQQQGECTEDGATFCRRHAILQFA